MKPFRFLVSLLLWHHIEGVCKPTTPGPSFFDVLLSASDSTAVERDLRLSAWQQREALEAQPSDSHVEPERPRLALEPERQPEVIEGVVIDWEYEQ